MKKILISVYILSKNEEQNIARCLDSLSNSRWPVFVLDSGSTDSTSEIVSRYSFASYVNFNYTNHCDSYNIILKDLALSSEFVIILDSDMVLSDDLKGEINMKIREQSRTWQVLESEVLMYVEGVPLQRASLYPPKPFLFETGKAIFVSTGHAEKLIDSVAVDRLKSKLIHDDRKPYGSYLQSQFRYSRSLIDRYHDGNVSGRDRWRVNWPFLIFLVPFYSLIFKMGFMDGRAGFVYALDRLIAEAIMYRQALASRFSRGENK